MKRMSYSYTHDDDDCYSAKHLINKLQEQHLDDMIITSVSGKETIYTLIDHSKRILRENY